MIDLHQEDENRCYLYHVSLGFEYLLFNGYQTRLPEPV